MIRFNRKPRDTQKHKIYAAENDLKRLSPKFENFEDCCKYVKKVCGSKWLLKKYEQRCRRMAWHTEPFNISVEEGRSNAFARGSYYANSISLPKWAQTELVALHEIAHVLVSHDRIAGHGPEFAKCFLDLVKHFMGKEMHATLKASFKKHKVRTKVRVKRIMTEEQKNVLRERISKARAAKIKPKETVLSPLTIAC